MVPGSHPRDYRIAKPGIAAGAWRMLKRNDDNVKARTNFVYGADKRLLGR